MRDTKTESDRAWTSGPWVSMAGTDDDYIEVEGMGGIRVEGAYRCEGYPVTVAAVVGTDEAGWEGIGCTYATARLIALAPEMAEAILEIDEAIANLDASKGTGSFFEAQTRVQRMARELRALFHPDQATPTQRGRT
jgi:hypothetical protein